MPYSITAAALTGYAVGIGTAASGAASLLVPHHALDFLGIPARARVPATDGLLRSLGLAAVATGAYHVLAARQNNRTFFLLAAPLQLLGAALLWYEGRGSPFRRLALFAGAGAVLSGAGLLLDYNKRRVRLQKRSGKSSPAAESDDVRETEGSEGEGKRRRLGRRGTKKSKN